MNPSRAFGHAAATIDDDLALGGDKIALPNSFPNEAGANAGIVDHQHCTDRPGTGDRRRRSEQMLDQPRARGGISEATGDVARWDSP